MESEPNNKTNEDEKIFEIRKIQLTGKSTYLVSLPKKWVEKIKLNKKDQVAIFESDIYKGSLIIDPQYSEVGKLKEVEIKIKNNEGFELGREIIAAYLFGYDIINITSDENILPHERDNIKANTQRLVGIEIVEESFKLVKLQCIISLFALPLDKTLDRIFLIVTQMLKDAILAITTNDKKLINNVIDRDNEVNRLYFLAVRQLRASIQDANIARVTKISPLQCLDYRVIAKAIENAGDNIVEIIGIYKNTIADQDLELPSAIKKHLSEIAEMVVKMMNKAKDVMGSHSMEKALQVIREDRASLKIKTEKLKNLLTGAEYSKWALSVDSIVDLLIKVSDTAAVDIADLVMR